MTARRLGLGLSLAAALLAAVASAAGIWLSDIYARESASWAAQGVGQDMVTLFIVCPALVVASYRAAAGSPRALLVSLGLLIYFVYSYLLYAFFVHFNRLFLVYVSVLGLSFWALVGLVSGISAERFAQQFQRTRSYRAQSLYLFVSGVAFGMLWIGEIAAALLRGTQPAGVSDVGLTVNPVHVLDLAFVLPAMIVTAVLLRKRHSLGLLFAAPLMTFAAAIGTAIIGMSLVISARGLGEAAGVVVVFVVLILIALDLTYVLLKPMRAHA